MIEIIGRFVPQQISRREFHLAYWRFVNVSSRFDEAFFVSIYLDYGTQSIAV